MIPWSMMKYKAWDGKNALQPLHTTFFLWYPSDLPHLVAISIYRRTSGTRKSRALRDDDTARDQVMKRGFSNHSLLTKFHCYNKVLQSNERKTSTYLSKFTKAGFLLFRVQMDRVQFNSNSINSTPIQLRTAPPLDLSCIWSHWEVALILSSRRSKIPPRMLMSKVTIWMQQPLRFLEGHLKMAKVGSDSCNFASNCSNKATFAWKCCPFLLSFSPFPFSNSVSSITNPVTNGWKMLCGQ